jgi:hypothetical protein
VPADVAATRFRSVLFETHDAEVELGAAEPDFFRDLNLDQVLAAITAGRDEYNLAELFYTPLRDERAVRYRHAVLRDLEKPEILDAAHRFAATMRKMREHLAQSARLRYEQQKQAWLVDAVELYCAAVRTLSHDLDDGPVTSPGLRGLRQYLAGYVDSDGFIATVRGAEEVKTAFNGLRYLLRIQGPRVTVSRYDGDPDYNVMVLETFARFRQGATKSYLVQPPHEAPMNHVEAQVLDLVAKLHPDVFALRADYCVRHGDFLDATIARFDREVQFYLGYLELIGRLQAAGQAFCYPRVSARSKRITATDTFDLALAIKLVPQHEAVVGNDLSLDDPERVLVVTGPNNGGKTTFARLFGQLHYLASLGLPVPGREARLFLPDGIFTHFERTEDIGTLRGKLDDELVRVHEILEHATPCSLIVLNESFNSTTLSDALFVGTAVMQRILELGALAVYVTFVDEIASLDPATVSIVAQIPPDDPTGRTFKLLRQPADGLAYASVIAAKYHLSYDRVIERIDR